MECNRDEALRAKEIAERKFESGDYGGARKFALKAQSLYPGLEDIQHMLATYDVYIAAEDCVGGEKNWYKVLGVDPNADVDAVIKQYRKLALQLHPDKNKSKGADGAFKLIYEARDVLCNSDKRSTFDKKRNTSVANNPVKASGGSCSNKSPAKKRRASKKKSSPARDAAPKKKSSPARKAASATTMPGQQQYPSTQTFWTLCRRCMFQYEYLRIHLNKNVKCPRCESPYCAFECPPPIQFQQNFTAQDIPYPNLFQRYDAQPQAHAEYNPWSGGSFQFNQTSSNWNPFAETANQAPPTTAQEVFERSRKLREEALNAIQRERQERQEGEADLKRTRVDEGPTGEISQGA